jgi:arginine-tRNA-protein transferase
MKGSIHSKQQPPMNNRNSEQSIRCFITVPFACSYPPEREARNLIIDPALPLTPTLLGDLLNLGFRRSGQHIYRPNCEQCRACISLRVPANRFQPNRSQRRNWQQNCEIEQSTTTDVSDEQFELYQRYINTRHSDSSMANPTMEEYTNFLTAPGIDTRFHEFRLHEKLIAVAVTDHTPQGLSAVYTFYDPELENRGIGTYAILWQIHHTQQLQLPWTYLGYWIDECDKMRYKNRFRPCQGYVENRWENLS